MTQRRYDIDAMRIFACYLQFVFHAGRVFDANPLYHVKAPEAVAAIGWLTDFLHAWRMPLFFFVSGWSAITVLQRWAGGRFVRDRLRRILPPLLFGIVVIAPVIKYIELSNGIDIRANGIFTIHNFNEPFALHYFRFFTEMRRFSYSHIWFLFYLLLYSLLLLPVLRRIAQSRLPRCPDAVLLLAPFLCLAASELALRDHFPDFPNLYGDWANHARFVLFFLLGALVARHQRFDAILAAHGLQLGAAGLVAGALMIVVPEGHARYVLEAMVAWGCVAGLYALFRHRVPPSPLVLRLSESTIALYVLHHVFLVAIASWTVAAGIWGWSGFAVVLVLATLVTQLVYETLVRNSPVLRKALGMRPEPRGVVAEPVLSGTGR
jgi:peptidoglycan/LPS O-acetylase OafA/YrhL